MNLESNLANGVRRTMVEAIAGFDMIEEGDRVMVCTSGGKDSSVMLVLLNEIRKRAPYNFTIEAALLDQGHPGFDPVPFKNWVESLGIKFHLLSKDTYSIVKEKVTDGVYCSLCSRLRRGILYNYAAEQGFTKIALGHHRDDLNETLMMNLFFTGRIASMPPKLKSDDGRNILIRPMSLVSESELRSLASEWQFPIIPCNLCGSQDGMQRQKMKALLKKLEIDIPGIQNSLIAAQKQVNLSQLMDERHWDFKGLEASLPTVSL